MTQLKITGMTCGHCQKVVKEALEHVSGVTAAEVDLAKGIAVIEGTAAAEALVQAVEAEGYSASLVAQP
jgi:copper chaperone